MGLIDATTRLLASGRPFRSLLGPLFDALAQAFGCPGSILVLPVDGGYRTAHERIQAEAEADGPGLEQHAARALQSASPAIVDGRLIAAAVRFAEVPIGAVAAVREAAWAQADAALFETWTQILSLSLHQHSVEEEYRRLEAIAEHDQLTGIANRRALDAALRAAFEKAKARRAPLSAIIFDIDYFKPYNDRYGHLAGDGALRRVAQALRACLHRPADIVARFGGEEFVAVLPETGENDAVALAERMRAAIADLRIPHEDSGLSILTASAGVATLLAYDTDPSDLLARADAALYRAKASGRNHVAGSTYLSQSEPAAHEGKGTHNMPPVRTRFVGRAKELERVGAAVSRSRLVTIAGPGGAGKTRLAVEAATAASRQFRDGAWFVDVSSVRDAEGVFGELAALLGVVQHGMSLADSVCERLRTPRMLLVLDGCERALAACRDAVETLLSCTEHLTVLAATREALGVPGESVVRLLGLQPDEAHALFLAHAGESSIAQSPRRDDLVESICRQVDYLPLGIELFASQLATMSLQQLELLVTKRMVPLRTLVEVIGWSVGLLMARHRKVFALLSVFAGGFTPEAAAVVTESESADLEVLAGKSLLVADERGGTPRYSMLDTMREFANRALDLHALELARGRHFEYYRALAASNAHDRLDPERENLAAALGYALEHRGAVDMLVLANALARFWLRRGYLSDGLHWLRLGLERAGSGDDPAVLALANRNAGMISRRVGDFEAARTYNERALQLWRSLDNFEGIASALNGLALVAHTVGEFDRAQILYEESLKQSEMLEDRLGVAMAANNLGGLAMFRGEYEAAQRQLEDAIERAGALGESSLEALATSNLGELRFLQERFGDAVELARRALHARELLNDRPGLAATRLLLGNALLSLNDVADAWQSIRESLLLCHEMGDRRGLAMALLAVARLAESGNRHEEAARLVSRADAMVAKSGAPLFGSDLRIRGMIRAEGDGLPIQAPADFEAAFEDALATFR